MTSRRERILYDQFRKIPHDQIAAYRDPKTKATWLFTPFSGITREILECCLQLLEKKRIHEIKITDGQTLIFYRCAEAVGGIDPLLLHVGWITF